MKHDTHTQHIMADTNSFYIRNCACGVIHLCFGFTTLNLTEEAVIAVTETLKEVSEDILRRPKSIHAMPSNSASSEGNVVQGHFPSLIK